MKLEKVSKEDLYDGSQEVMQIRVANPLAHKRVFREANEHFPDLTYSNVDIPLTVQYAAAYNVFMMARCKVIAEPDGKLIEIQALDKPDDLDPKLPRLRMMYLRPDTDPSQVHRKR